MPATKKTVFVGMSGGVDSSVAATLLLSQGHDVVGAFMKNWSETVNGASATCGWEDERRDALRVAAQLGIPFVTFDFEKEYRASVADYLYKEYAAGRTPNPDVLCNKVVKFDLFLRRAIAEGADIISTGNYARVDRTAAGEYRLLAGTDPAKDQSYFLHQLSQEQLSRSLFPIGHLLKTEVRAIARRERLPTADKKDSTGICFIGNVDMKVFLARRIPAVPGDILSVGGAVVGRHAGAASFTIGQRHGLGVGGKQAYFVVAKDIGKNTVTVTDDAQHQSLYARIVATEAPHWIAGAVPAFPYACQARIRYRQPLEPAIIHADQAGGLRVEFARPQRAVTPGQFVAFYDGECCVGGAVISRGYDKIATYS